MLDDVRYLKLTQEDAEADAEGHEQAEAAVTVEAPQNMVEHFVERSLAKDPAHPPIFFCMDGALHLELSKIHNIPLREDGSSVSVEELYDALKAIFRRPFVASQEALAFREREQHFGTVYSYLIENQEPIFNSAWGDIIFESKIGGWKHRRRVVLEAPRAWSIQNNKTSASLEQLTVYFVEPDQQKKSDQPPISRLIQEVYEVGDTQYKEYPLPVFRIPFQKEKLKGDGVVISPIYNALTDQLVEIKDTNPASEENAIRNLLKKNENFCALVDWVYRFQVPVNGQKYHTRAEIAEIYFQWVWDYYNEL